MNRFLDFSRRAGLRGLLRAPVPRPSFGRVAGALTFAAFTFLVFVGGAAVMHFELPGSGYLGNAFVGGRAWWERARAPARGRAELPRPDVAVDERDRTFPGYTLYTTTLGPRAALIDMRGAVVHEWSLPFSRAFPDPPHVKHPLADDRIHRFRCHLYPNGDLLAVYHAEGDTPYGYGLVKLDKDSNLLWSYPANVHHDADVGEDGRIYTLTQEVLRKPPAGLYGVSGPILTDYLVVLSPRGEELEKIPLLEAFRDSPYAVMLSALGGARPRPHGAGGHADKGDILHANSVRVLRAAAAAKFPLFKAGQVLVSVRQLDAVVVLDPRTRSLVWAAAGLWRGQHDAEFLDSGRLLLFDNLGGGEGARVLEYDPVTQAVPWAYARGQRGPLVAPQRGAGQRLANGNTLIVDPDNCQLLEVTPTNELVWECTCVAPGGAPAGPDRSRPSITSARRYGAGELTFLEGGARARP
jgi:hypothetical protein